MTGDPLDSTVGAIVATLPDGTEYRQVLGNPTEGVTHVTPDGRTWIAVHEAVVDGQIIRNPLTIHWKAAAQLQIATISLPVGVVSQAYSASVAAAGGVAPYSFSVAAGSLPVGLGLNSTTGVIAGRPSTAGEFSFIIGVSDSGGRTATRQFTITIATMQLQIITVLLPDGVVSQTYSSNVAATGGVAPYKYFVAAGSLPDGVILNAATGAIGGSPTTAGVFNFVIGASDLRGGAATREFSITVGKEPRATLDPAIESSLRRQFAAEFLKLQSPPPPVQVLVVTTQLKDIAPPLTLTRIRLTISEEGVEWTQTNPSDPSSKTLMPE